MASNADVQGANVQPIQAAVVPGPTIQAVAGAASLAVKLEIIQRLTGWVTGAAPQLGDGDEFLWFLSKRASTAIDKWLADKKLAVLTPVSPARTGCILVSRVAVEHCRDHRAAEGVSQAAAIELLTQLFAKGSPAYAPNTSKGSDGHGYNGQLVMFDATYKSVDPTSLGERAAGILQHEVDVSLGAPLVRLKLVTGYWTKPKSAADLERLSLTGQKK